MRMRQNEKREIAEPTRLSGNEVYQRTRAQV